MKRRRQDPDTLIWEYLDGEISPSRAGILSSLLKRRPAVREQFVDSAVMHGMLFTYFADEAKAREAREQEEAEVYAQVEAKSRKRRRQGRSSAA